MQVDFDLTESGVSGTIPSQLGRMTGMSETFSLFGNSLTGAIPSELGSWTGMTSYFQLSYNSLCDEIPTEVSALSTQVTSWYILTGNSLGTPCGANTTASDDNGKTVFIREDEGLIVFFAVFGSLVILVASGVAYYYRSRIGGALYGNIQGDPALNDAAYEPLGGDAEDSDGVNVVSQRAVSSVGLAPSRVIRPADES